MSTVDPRHETDERRTWCAEYNGEALFADGFDDAIFGVAERGGQPPLVVYDADRCIEILIERDGATYTEALEDISVNAMGAWLGDGTPLFLWRYKAMAGP